MVGEPPVGSEAYAPCMTGTFDLILAAVLAAIPSVAGTILGAIGYFYVTHTWVVVLVISVLSLMAIASRSTPRRRRVRF